METENNGNKSVKNNFCFLAFEYHEKCWWFSGMAKKRNGNVSNSVILNDDDDSNDSNRSKKNVPFIYDVW